MHALRKWQALDWETLKLRGENAGLKKRSSMFHSVEMRNAAYETVKTLLRYSRRERR